MFSTIKKKKCKCSPHCKYMPSIGYGGYYKTHAPESIKERQDGKTNRQRSEANNRKLAKVKSLMFSEVNLETKERMELNKWYDNIAKEIEKNPYCWECDAPISRADFINATAHIFPKTPNGGFPSVATHPLNFLVLGARCGCHNKTHRLDTFSQMKVFAIACDRFIQFQHQIKERHKYLNLFRQYAVEKTNF